MPYALDPELAAALAVLPSPTSPPPARGDWQAIRAIGNAGWAAWSAAAPTYPDVHTTSFFAETADGAKIELRWFVREGSSPGSAVVYAHGGGMILASVDLYAFVIAEYVAKSGVPFLAVEYRLAPQSTGTMLAEDVLTGLTWLTAHADELGIDPSRIALMGDSGGGCPAAGAAILARDHGIAVAKQILIYPMLDDQNLVPDPRLLPFATWTYDHNFTGWSALLGERLCDVTVSPAAVPARLKDAAGLAPVYIEVGELDIFRDEDIRYAQKLAVAGVPVELHVHSGANHGFDRLAPTSKLSLRAMQDRLRVIGTI
ncbi:alpha/beta hydrolase [Phyllobacterium sp. OV277]|uniref:alpha/beta hydrolase n=1 Tax=Phyllobacterium sp. OV277 TaxID=1882772 RepID=UPI000888EFC9|nr:alpha/beta hydrolase [Phyllobacterium sp. OV277]SDP68613.1 Acetyl esterase/lipase [Phyllobacterium sp. OV277]